mgnify:CR=1 FL=1
MKVNVFAAVYELMQEKLAHNIRPPMVPVLEIYEKLCPKGYNLEMINRELNAEITNGRIGKSRGINGDLYYLE